MTAVFTTLLCMLACSVAAPKFPPNAHTCEVDVDKHGHISRHTLALHDWYCGTVMLSFH